jgi:putative membrane protein (TIGR04086 family)
MKEKESEQQDISRNFRYALIIGAVAGILSVVLDIAINLSNLSTFQQVAHEGLKVSYNIALTAASLSCLNFFATLLICLAAGYLVGRFVIERRFGFYAGVLAGIIIYLSRFIVNYIHNYPGKFTPDVVTAIVFLCIWSFIGGMASLLGAWLATRRHPYYRRSS